MSDSAAVEPVRFTPDPESTLTFSPSPTARSAVTLTLASSADHKLTFKVLLNHPNRYIVRPSAGVLQPGEIATIAVVFEPAAQRPPDAADCKNLIKIQVAKLSGPEEDVAELWKTIPKSELVAKARYAVAIDVSAYDAPQETLPAPAVAGVGTVAAATGSSRTGPSVPVGVTAAATGGSSQKPRLRRSNSLSNKMASLKEQAEAVTRDIENLVSEKNEQENELQKLIQEAVSKRREYKTRRQEDYITELNRVHHRELVRVDHVQMLLIFAIMLMSIKLLV